MLALLPLLYILGSIIFTLGSIPDKRKWRTVFILLSWPALLIFCLLLSLGFYCCVVLPNKMREYLEE